VEDPGAFNISKNNLAPAPLRFVAPWARSSTPGYDNGGNKFDLNTWDPSYFARLKDFIRQADKRNIIVEVTLFSSLYGSKEGWKSSPLHPGNNINATDALDSYKKVHTLDNGNILQYQEKMVRKIVSELKEFKNLFYEIQNEPWADNGVNVGEVNQPDTTLMEWQRRVEAATKPSLTWQKHIASVITDEESTYKYKHLVAQNMTNFAHKLTDADPAIGIFNFHYAFPEAITQNYDLNRVIGFDESGFAGKSDDTYRRQAWRFVLAGGGLFNNLDYSFTVAKPNGTDSQEAPGGGSPTLRLQLQVLKEFMDNLSFIEMKPDNSIIANQLQKGIFVLSNQGKDYAIYIEKNLKEGLQLTLPAGKYKAEWLNTSTGQAGKSEKFSHAGGTLTLAGHGNTADRVVRIRLTN
jgi:hypothetical protein